MTNSSPRCDYRELRKSAARCSRCGGGGLIPASNCQCRGSRHTCSPATCPACHGSGVAR
ncbi:MAG TPA: hypothetical protein VGG83_03245 [Trebonia sp.]|jgi:hypothetical protein